MQTSEKIKEANRKTQETFRANQRAMGRVRWHEWVTIEEKEVLKNVLAQIRGEE